MTTEIKNQSVNTEILVKTSAYSIEQAQSRSWIPKTGIHSENRIDKSLVSNPVLFQNRISKTKDHSIYSLIQKTRIKAALTKKGSSNILLFAAGAIAICCGILFLFVPVFAFGGIEGLDNETICYQYFLQKGLSEKQSAAILGNIAIESEFKPEALSESGTYFGLFQLGGKRRFAMESIGTDLYSQLEYIWLEDFTWQDEYAANNFYALQENFFGTDERGESLSFFETDDLTELTRSFMMNVERCYTPEMGWQKEDERIQKAFEFYERFHKESISVSTLSISNISGFTPVLKSPKDWLPDFTRMDCWGVQNNWYDPGQCTWYACGMLLQIYGTGFDFNFSGGMGNGINWVDSLTQRYPQYFKKSPVPVSGAVFSGGELPYGHVGLVLQVEGEMMVILDGNYDGVSNTFEEAKTDWKITRVSIRDFQSVYHAVFANPCKTKEC